MEKSRKAVCVVFYELKPSHMNAVDGYKVPKVWVGKTHYGEVRGQSLQSPLLYILMMQYAVLGDAERVSFKTKQTPSSSSSTKKKKKKKNKKQLPASFRFKTKVEEQLSVMKMCTLKSISEQHR